MLPEELKRREDRLKAIVEAKAHPARARMAAKLATPEGRARYARRKWLSEAPNGWIKQALGFRRFSVRGLTKVQGEWALVCLALNMKRMQRLAIARFIAGEPPGRPTETSYDTALGAH